MRRGAFLVVILFFTCTKEKDIHVGLVEHFAMSRDCAFYPAGHALRVRALHGGNGKVTINHTVKGLVRFILRFCSRLRR